MSAHVIDIPTLVLGEHAENENRKDFTPSERVAIGLAVEAELKAQGERRGRPKGEGEIVQNFAQFESGQKTIEVAAEKAGFGNKETYRQAKTVVETAAPELVEAMDSGAVAVSTAARLEMTLDEARETDRLIKRHINTTRYLLLDMRDRKGWKALGYESFKEYGEKELGYQENYIHKLVNAAEISLQIGFDQDCTIVQPKESHLRPLTQVPEEVRREIWEEATRKAQEEGVKMTAKRVEEAVAEWKQRTEEFRAESNECRQTIRELEQWSGALRLYPRRLLQNHCRAYWVALRALWAV